MKTLYFRLKPFFFSKIKILNRYLSIKSVDDGKRDSMKENFGKYKHFVLIGN